MGVVFQLFYNELGCEMRLTRRTILGQEGPPSHRAAIFHPSRWTPRNEMDLDLAIDRLDVHQNAEEIRGCFVDVKAAE